MKSSRNSTIDIARGLTVLLMPAVHTTLFYAEPAVSSGPLGFILSMFTAGPGATLLMFLMGFSFVFARKRPLAGIARRSGLLWILAYLMNFLKAGLPSLLGLFPHEYYTIYGIPHNIFGFLNLLTAGNIFQFVAIAYPICAILNRFRYGSFLAGLLGCFVILFSPSFWGHNPGIFIFDYFVKFFNGHPPAVNYPFFPWAAYPLTGLFFGYLMLNMERINFEKLLLRLGIVLFIFGSIMCLFEPALYNISFYRLGPGGTLFHIGIVLLWMRLCYHLSEKIRSVRFLALLRKLSTHITLVYIIQWLLVCCLLPLFGFRAQGLAMTFLAILLISTLSFCFSFFLTRIISNANPKI